MIFCHCSCHIVKTPRGAKSDVCILRPRNTCKQMEKQQGDDPVDLGTHVIDLNLYQNALIQFQREHRQAAACKECVVLIDFVKKNGLTCNIVLKCGSKGCEFERAYRLYKVAQESRRGPKRAAVNKQFAHAVQDSTLGMHGACQLFASLDLAAPAASICQRWARLADVEMTELNARDMQGIREQVMEDNGLLGLPPDEIAISVDTRYNSTHFGDRKKMGASATQAITTAIDSCGGSIVEFVMENKVCSKGCRLRIDDNTVVCAHDSTHHECSATLPATENIMEGIMNTKLGKKLCNSGFTPVTVTSDNDGQAAKPYQSLSKDTPVLAQSDPTHLANSQVRAVEKMNIRKEAFSCTKVKSALVLKKLLAKDIKYRSSTIVQCAKEMALTDSQVGDLAHAAVRCFTGDHQQCLGQVGSSCSAQDDDNWMRCSSLYKVAGVEAINFNEHERTQLLSIFNIRLHSKALAATRLGFSTQRNEAFNRVLSKNLPKNLLFSRNALGRASSAVYRYNNGHASSVINKMSQFGCPLSSQGKTQLLRQQKFMRKLTKNQVTEPYRQRRAAVRMRAAQDWFKRKNTTTANEHDYSKGQNDPFRFEELRDHHYSK